jgi:hypothetical protein
VREVAPIDEAWQAPVVPMPAALTFESFFEDEMERITDSTSFEEAANWLP